MDAERLSVARVAVVLVNWNGVRHLRRCLPALRASLLCFGEPVEVVVVDNGSSDGSLGLLAAEPWVRVVANATNRGFAAAANQGIAASTAEIVVMLNNDTVVDRGWLAPLVAAIDSDARVGSAGAQLRFLDAPDVIASAGIEVERCGIPRDRMAGEPAFSGPPEPVFGVSAGAAAYRRAMLAQIGAFEARYFAYLEDVDLAWRARRAGWLALHVPESLVLHAHSGTARQGSALKAGLLARNRLWLVARNQNPRSAPRWLPRFLALELGACAVDLVTRRSTASSRGLFRGLLALPAVVRARPRMPYMPSSSLAPAQPLLAWLAQRRRRDRLTSPA